MQERRKWRKAGKHDDYRPYVCVFFEREGAERKKGPPAKSREKERKKRSVKSPSHTKPFFYTTQNIHFPSFKAAKIEPPTPQII